MTPDELRQRTRTFALDILGLSRRIRCNDAARILVRQLVRAATSVGANYRAACLAKSTSDFLYKLKVVEEEADECLYWIDLLAASGLASDPVLRPLVSEAGQLKAIMSASVLTVRSRLFNRQS